MGFVGDGFKNADFLVGIVTIIIVALLIIFSKFIMMGILFIIGSVVGLAIIGFFGKVIGTILALFSSNKPPEGGDKS